MKYKRGFFSGVISINDILNISSVYVRQIDKQNMRLYQVKALPNNEIIFWSDSRKKTNVFIKREIIKRNLSYTLDDSIKYKSLDYNYTYTPGSYIIMSLAFMCIALIIGVNKSEGTEWVLYFLVAGSIYGLIMTIASSKNIKTLTSRSSRV